MESKRVFFVAHLSLWLVVGGKNGHFDVPSLKLTAKAHENPIKILVNTIKMVDFPASYVSFRDGNRGWSSTQ